MSTNLDQPNFFQRQPFAKRRTFEIWIKTSVILTGILISILGLISWRTYQKINPLKVTQANLQQSLVATKSAATNKRSRRKEIKQIKKTVFHNQIIQLLNEIESILPSAVHLTELEATENQINLSGFSYYGSAIADFLSKLHQVKFTKQFYLEQISRTKKVGIEKLAFTVVLKINQ